MLETICYLLLGVSYVAACAQGRKEEEERKKKTKIRELKTKVFCYAIMHHMLYNDVVKMLQDKKLTFEEINKDLNKNETK